MKKSILKPHLLSILLAALLSCFCLTACSDDDDDEPKSSSSSIVGTWRQDFGNGFQILTINSSGTYTLKEIDHVSGNWTETGTWELDEDMETIIFSYRDSGEYCKDFYRILSISRNEMTLQLTGESVGGNIHTINKTPEYWTRE